MSELSETDEPDSPCGWPLMSPVRPSIETRRLIMREPTDAERLESVEREARTRGRIEGSLVMAAFVITGLTIGSLWTA